MALRKYRGIPYHLWNPFTVMDEFLPLLGTGHFVIVRGEGPYVFNDRGKRYINGLSSCWNVAIGHGRKELVKAASDQMHKMAFASCFRQVHPKALELAARLVDITAGRFQHVYLGSNGSEAVEAALKMARQYHRQSPKRKERGRYKIISLKGSYHGVSYGAVSTSGLKRDEAKFGPLLPGFLQIEPPYCYRCPYGESRYPECALACAAALEKRIQTEGEDTVAAFIMEPIMGVKGIIDPPEEYYKRAGEICRRYRLLFIVDEVTTGFGRTGKLFASQNWRPGPDILCLGKGISSGYLPLAATLASEAVFERFIGRGNQFDHGSTASGHPVCAAVGLANIDIILKEDLARNAEEVGSRLKSRLQEVLKRHRQVGDVRGRGLMLGIELVKNRRTKVPLSADETFHLVLDIAKRGLIVYHHDNVLALFPPLILDSRLADTIVGILDKALGALRDGSVRKTRLSKKS